jgi:hypothetical protein
MNQVRCKARESLFPLDRQRHGQFERFSLALNEAKSRHLWAYKLKPTVDRSANRLARIFCKTSKCIRRYRERNVRRAISSVLQILPSLLG